MPTPVEANSLSSLTQIAGNPPRYPRNPSEQKREPLVLYIARVPGTQDVILTPLKPDLKNLKEIDVASCLYYLHRDLPTDAVEPEPEPEPRPSQEQQIARKPLPDLSAVAVAEREKNAAAALQALNQTRVSYLDESNPPPEDGTRPSQASSLKDPRPSTENDTPPTRRPLGPRPLSTVPLGRQSLDASSYGKENAPFSAPTSSTATSLARARANIILPLSPSPPPSKNYSITLIRRDPNSAAQWNIGNISISSTSSASSSASETTISIHLTTPGYAQFTPTPLQGFTRHIHTSHSSFWDNAFKHHRGHARNHSDTPPKNPFKHHLHTRHKSSSTPSTSTSTSASTPSSPPKPQPQKQNSYTLTSPWDGTCTFTTGPSGRSLRCTHHLASPNTNATADTPAVLVSELRYNLPTAALFAATALTAQKLKRHSKTALPLPRRLSATLPAPPLPPRPVAGSDDDANADDAPGPALPPRPVEGSYAAIYGTDDEDDGERGGLDLRLGRERAGGGKRGKRAKMGKLIVYGEGIKMLDLVVAGNMGVWWGGWEG